MTYQILDVPQRSAEWFAARLGRLTASDAGKMLATIKSGEAAARRDLRARLVAERLTGISAGEVYTNADMERGVELEPVARQAYEAYTGVTVTQVGFLQSVEHMAGASPDGVIDDMRGLVEIKCPRTARHLDLLKMDSIPKDYRPQLLHQLWISGAEYVDLVSYDPWLPKRLRVCILRLNRDAKELAEYEREALRFLAGVQVDTDAWLTMSGVTQVLSL
jgi:putative phage-type endonuclease